MGAGNTLKRVGLSQIMPGGRVANRGLDEKRDEDCIMRVKEIMDEIRAEGETALLRLSASLDGRTGKLWYGPMDFSAALRGLDLGTREALERAASRMRLFAEAQVQALGSVTIPVPGGLAGHEVLPVERAGCYVPGGRYALPSSALMTAAVAKTAGVPDVTAACPRPTPLVLAACALAGVDLLCAAGGAQAIAAMTFGCGPLVARDVVVGPGNRYVSAAKRLAQAWVRTDAPAGPSELLVIADASASPSVVAWDLLAQAEHDPEAVPALAAVSESFVLEVEAELEAHLEELPPVSAETARLALANGWAFISADRKALAEVANRFAPEHLELALERPAEMQALCLNAGAIFRGLRSAEVFGDYGIGPNHTLPTSGRSRSSGGLSVYDFLRIRTWLDLDGSDAMLIEDTAILARAEGLEAHARSALARLDH